MKSPLVFSFALTFAALLLTACAGDPPAPASTDAAAPAQTQDDSPSQPAPMNTQPASDTSDETAPPTASGVVFNRRATGSGTATVDGVPYTFEVYLCGAPVIWNDRAYPEGSEETAFYVDPDQAELDVLEIAGAGTQKDGAVFMITAELDNRSGTTEISVSRLVLDDPSQSWSYSSSLNTAARLDFDPPRFKSAERGPSLLNPEGGAPIRISFDATCETYGGTFDTGGKLAAEVIGVTLPGSGTGGFILNGESYAFEPETCLLKPEQGAALIEGEGERFSLSVDLQGRAGPLFIALNLLDPPRSLGLLTFDEIPLVVEGTRLYAPQTFELTRGTDEAVPFSLDITCPDADG